MRILAPLLEVGWTMNDIRRHSPEDLVVASTLLARIRILRNPVSPNEAGKIISDHPEMVDAVNQSLMEQRKMLG